MVNGAALFHILQTTTGMKAICKTSATKIQFVKKTLPTKFCLLPMLLIASATQALNNLNNLLDNSK